MGKFAAVADDETLMRKVLPIELRSHLVENTDDKNGSFSHT